MRNEIVPKCKELFSSPKNEIIVKREKLTRKLHRSVKSFSAHRTKLHEYEEFFISPKKELVSEIQKPFSSIKQEKTS